MMLEPAGISQPSPRRVVISAFLYRRRSTDFDGIYDAVSISDFDASLL